MVFHQKPLQKNNWFLFAVLCFGFALVGEITTLVMVYNHTVSIRHEISALDSRIQKIQADNAAGSDSVFSILDADRLESLARERNLVKETEPHYFELEKQWVFASR